jgi:MFS family permease
LPVCYPRLGGAFTEHVTWRLCFLINLPCGLITAAFVFFYVPGQPESPRRKHRTVKQIAKGLDLVGLAVFIPMIVCLLLALQWGGTLHAWRNARIIALFTIFGLLLAVFVLIQRWQKDEAMIPPAIMRLRTSIACSLFVFFIYGAFVILSYFLPIWFQAIKGVSPLRSGIETLPMVLGTVLFSLVGGGLVAWLGYYTWACMLSSICTAVVSNHEFLSNKSLGYQADRGLTCCVP